MVDARLADGSRVNVVIPPLSVDGPVALDPPLRARAARSGGAGRARDPDPSELRDLLAAAVAGRRSILISGGTGSGKTTLLNALSRFIDARRACGHDRGRRRAPPPAAARRPAREPAGQRRGQGGGDDPRPAPQRPADAARPDRDRRGARGRRRSTCSPRSTPATTARSRRCTPTRRRTRSRGSRRWPLMAGRRLAARGDRRAGRAAASTSSSSSSGARRRPPRGHRDRRGR